MGGIDRFGTGFTNPLQDQHPIGGANSSSLDVEQGEEQVSDEYDIQDNAVNQHNQTRDAGAKADLSGNEMQALLHLLERLMKMLSQSDDKSKSKEADSADDQENAKSPVSSFLEKLLGTLLGTGSDSSETGDGGGNDSGSGGGGGGTPAAAPTATPAAAQAAAPAPAPTPAPTPASTAATGDGQPVTESNKNTEGADKNAGATPANKSAASGKQSDVYVNPDASLQSEIAARKSTDPAGAAALQKMADQPVSMWLSGTPQDKQNLQTYLDNAQKEGKEGAVTMYNIPNRDRGNYSAGGAGDAQSYKNWVGDMSKAIGDKKTTVYLEPDALMDSTRMDPAQGAERLAMIKDAVNTIKTNNPNATVMLAAGNQCWGDPQKVAETLKAAGIEKADGFSVGESSYITTDKQKEYGDAVCASLEKMGIKGKQFDIDTSRNGATITATGDAAWANPEGAASGHTPTSDQSIINDPNVRSYAWIKTPWQADGRIAEAGSFVPQYAIDLIKNAEKLGTL